MTFRLPNVNKTFIRFTPGGFSLLEVQPCQRDALVRTGWIIHLHRFSFPHLCKRKMLLEMQELQDALLTCAASGPADDCQLPVQFFITHPTNFKQSSKVTTCFVDQQRIVSTP